MSIGHNLPVAPEGNSRCTDGEVNGRGWTIDVLSLWFQVSMGSIIEDAQVMKTCESLNNFSSSVVVWATPQLIVTVKIPCNDKLTISVFYEI